MELVKELELVPVVLGGMIDGATVLLEFPLFCFRVFDYLTKNV